MLHFANANINANTPFSTSDWTSIGGNLSMMQGDDQPDLAITPPAVASFTTQNAGKQLLYYRTSTKVLYTYNIGTSSWEVASPVGANSWRGGWDIDEAYDSNVYVDSNNKIYRSNGAIAANAGFTIGTTGATWIEISMDGASSGSNTWRGLWLLGNSYNSGDYVELTDKLYKSNAVIPASTSFVLGTTGLSWREVSSADLLSGTSSWRGLWLVGNQYIQGDYVERSDKLYRSNNIIAINTLFAEGTTGATWTEVSLTNLLSGTNSWRGSWLTSTNYNAGDFVVNTGKIYQSNQTIPSGTGFTIGTTGLTWIEVSSNGGTIKFLGAWLLAPTYSPDQYVIYNDKIYTPNDVIPVSTAFLIGTTGATWKSVSQRKPKRLTNNNVSGTFDLDWSVTTYRLTLVNNVVFTQSNMPVGDDSDVMTIYIDGEFSAGLPAAWLTPANGGAYDGTKVTQITIEIIDADNNEYYYNIL